MEGKEEIEGNYKKKTEELDRGFLESLKNPQTSVAEIETNYKENLRKTVEEYENQYKELLENSKESLKKEKSKTTEKKEDKKRLEVKPLNLSPTRKERISVRWTLFKFRSKIRIKNFFRRHFPNSIIIRYLRIKLKTKTIISETKNKTNKFLIKLKDNLVDLFKKVKGSILKLVEKLYLKTKKIYVKVLEKAMSFRKKDSKNEKSEDEKIALKLLKKEKS